jgi:broad specificity phosphatase PhoE
MPFELVTSPEPKALATAEAVGRAHGVAFRVAAGLREIDRPALPLLSREEHERFNAPLFVEYDRAVIGAESARDACTRFHGALAGIAAHGTANLVVIAHGTVIALFVAQHNPTDAFELWCSLACASFVVLDRRFQLVDGPVATV